MGRFDAHRVRPSRKDFALGKVSPSETPAMKRSGRKKARKLLAKEHERLKALQYRLYAEHKKSLLVVLQALDTGGKDGTIRKVFGPINPQGVKVAGFKKPTAEELRHPFLWRIRNALPPKGLIGIFNRSHYEDILVPTVWKTLPPAKIAPRYGEIVRFERELAASGTRVLKFYLHISKDEQKRRLQDRLDTPEKNWKFDPGDLKTRLKWNDFIRAYSRILGRTSTMEAPWYAIPADNKWYRDIAIARIVREALEDMDPRFPEPAPGLDELVIPD